MRKYLLICIYIFIAISSISCSNSAGKEVDLGLSVNWAECNLGASSPEEYGDYYAWGELTPKEVYSRETYLWHDPKNREITLYEDNISGWNGLDPAADKWANGWRMPTASEINELIEKCTFSSNTYNGVKGLVVTGPNGNSIFLPTGGHMMDSYCHRFGGILEFPFEYDSGYYWSGTLNNYWASRGKINSDSPIALSISHSDCNAENVWTHSILHYYGCLIRPVKSK